MTLGAGGIAEKRQRVLLLDVGCGHCVKLRVEGVWQATVGVCGSVVVFVLLIFICDVF